MLLAFTVEAAVWFLLAVLSVVAITLVLALGARLVELEDVAPPSGLPHCAASPKRRAEKCSDPCLLSRSSKYIGGAGSL